jgi:EmrB/QacA subfamily drug resistance transporter
MVILDSAIVNVAIPSMTRSLQLSTSGQQWVINAYILTLGGFLLLGGRLTDLFGRRRVFLVGLVLFTVASLAGGLATSGGMLIIARTVQGLGAAILAPATLSILATTYTEPAHRTRALTVWAVTTTVAGIAGILLGGALTSALSWRWVLFVNVPIGAALLVAAVRHLAEVPGSARGWRSLDVLGAATVTAGVALTIYGVVSSTSTGWLAAKTLTFLVLGPVLIGVFVVIETQVAAPLIPLRMFRTRTIAAATVIAFFLGAAATSFLFFVSLYLQQVQGYSPIRAGAAMIPALLATAGASVAAGRLIHVLGPRTLLMIGGTVAAVGTFWLSRLSFGQSYLDAVLAPSVVAMIGMGLCTLPMATLATRGVAAQDAGLASGMLNASRQIGGAIGLATLVTASASRRRAYSSTHLALGSGVRPSLVAGYDLAFVLAAASFLVIVGYATFGLPTNRASASAVARELALTKQ